MPPTRQSARARKPVARRQPARRPELSYLLSSLSLWAAATVLLVAGAGWLPYLAWLAAGTVVTALLYGLDKLLAPRSGRRVPELVLLTLTLLGGVGGAWIGMLFFRHKTLHNTFWLTLILATALHAALAWLLISGRW